jgi:hypothetical protein
MPILKSFYTFTCIHLKTRIMKKRARRTKLICLLITIFITTAAFSQEKPAGKVAYGGVGYFQMGYAFFNQGNLNQLLNASGMPELENGSLSLGGGGHSIIRNFIVGGEGHGLIGNESENNNYKVSQSGGYGFFNLGYLVVQKPAFNVYPILGIGGGGSSVTITDKRNLPSNFGDLLANPNQQSNLSKGGFMLNFSLGADYFIAGETNDKSTEGFLIGLRVGYLLELNQNNWSIAGQELSGGPDSGISGPFVRLTIGGGGIGK